MQATCAEITSSKSCFLINLHNLVGFEGTGFPIYQTVVGSYSIFLHELGMGTHVSQITVPFSDLFIEFLAPKERFFSGTPFIQFMYFNKVEVI